MKRELDEDDEWEEEEIEWVEVEEEEPDEAPWDHVRLSFRGRPGGRSLGR